MQSHKNIIRLTCCIFLLFWANERIYAGGQDVSAVKAMQLFDAGNYAGAEKMFGRLLDEDPRNPMLNYYYGASRTENGHFGDEDLNHLLLAGKKVTPDRLNYYLGKQYHARDNWEQALKFYNQFRLSVPENEQQKLGIAEKIQQCFNQVNPFTVSANNQNSEEPEISRQNEKMAEAAQPKQFETARSEILSENDSTKSETKPGESISTHEFNIGRKILPDLPGVETTYELPEGEQIEFQVNNSISYLFSSQFKTAEGRELFNEGQSLKTKLEQKIKEAGKLREEYGKTSNPGEKAALGDRILTLESDSYALQDEINKKITAARNAENKFWSHAGSVAVYNFQIENEKIKSVLRGEPPEPGTTPPQKDTIVILSLADSDIYEPKPSGTDRQAGQLVYKIQIGAYSRGVPAYRKRMYDKLSFIRKIENYTDEDGVVVYTTGNLTNLEDAEKMRNQVRQEGIEDAIVVPYFNGKRITLEQAKKIEAGDDS